MPAATEYEAAWRALSEPLAWMQTQNKLSGYWGWNLADIANDLIRRAYPGLADVIPATPDSLGASLRDRTCEELRR